MTTTTPVLQYDHIARSYRADHPVLADVSFSVHAGEVVALLGRNGAGKTTLIHLAMGMLFPHAGTVGLFGLDPVKEPVAVKRRIGYVAEDQVLPGRMKIPDVLAIHRRVFPSWDRALERELLDRFGLAGNTSRIDRLSKGEARQVALVCAVSHRPDLLILDEPAGGLDPVARREVLDTSYDLLSREGTTILFSSHHMDDVQRVGGRIVAIDEGRVALDETLDDLRMNYCVAIVPRDAIADPAALEGMSGCLHVRGVPGKWRAVFRGAPSQVEARLRTELGIAGASCESGPLEDLFVDLLGGERARTSS